MARRVGSQRRRYEAMLRRLRAARKTAGLTQAEVAAKFGRRQPWLSNIETGERRLDVVELADLAKLYGVTVSELLGD